MNDKNLKKTLIGLKTNGKININKYCSLEVKSHNIQTFLKSQLISLPAYIA